MQKAEEERMAREAAEAEARIEAAKQARVQSGSSYKVPPATERGRRCGGRVRAGAGG